MGSGEDPRIGYTPIFIRAGVGFPAGIDIDVGTCVDVGSGLCVGVAISGDIGIGVCRFCSGAG